MGKKTNAIDKEIMEENKRLESRYGYLPESEEEQEKHLLDEIIEWLKSKRGGYLDKLMKSI